MTEVQYARHNNTDANYFIVQSGKQLNRLSARPGQRMASQKERALWDEKQRLINLFLAEIGRTSLEIDRKKNVPTGVVLARAKGELFDIGDVTFTGKPEYELAVYHVKLYETEGIRLAQLLGSSGRKHFWAATGYLRDAEAVRLVIKQLRKEDRDYAAYEKVFVALIGKGPMLWQRSMQTCGRNGLLPELFSTPSVGLIHEHSRYGMRRHE